MGNYSHTGRKKKGLPSGPSYLINRQTLPMKAKKHPGLCFSPMTEEMQNRKAMNAG
jgi:hypothetical protein